MPVVVQGTPVGDPYASSGNQQSPAVQQTSAVSDGGAFTHGEKQESKCRDPIFALLLYANVIAMIIVAGLYGKDAFDANTQNFQYEGYVYAVLITAAISLAVSALGVMVMMRIPQFLIKTSLIFVVVLSGVWAVFAFASGAIAAGIFGLIFFAIGICYAYAVWSRIPFATANLVTGITAIQDNWGIAFVAYFLVIMAAVWSMVWSIALAGVWDSTYTCDANGNNCGNPNYGYLFLLFLSYFFTHQVLQNCIHVTVAGVVGTWWIAPEEGSSCCSPAVRDSFTRTMTTSFGSICFGSLLVALIQTLKALANEARNNGDAGILACIAECILGCLEAIVEYFNKWAFIYVGLYGYSYLEAGKNVFTLFQNRGWEAIIADDLVGNTLFLVSLVVGGIMGVVGMVLEVTTDWFADAAGSARLVAFLLGFIVGIVISSILLSTIASAVNAVIVLFAEAPAEFERNYPDLSAKMRETWIATFPGSL